jgi:L-malate glycosyltransferase
LRVLHCLPWIESAGVERSLLEIVRHLRPPAYEHHVVCAVAERPIADELRDLGAQIDRIRGMADMWSTVRYREALAVARRWRPDLVHGAVMEGIATAAVVAKRLRIPLVNEEAFDPANRSWRGHLVARSAFTMADLCVAASPFVARYLTDTLRLPERKVRTVVYGVPEPVRPPATELVRLRRELGIGETAVVIGTVSRLSDDHKRVSDLLAAIARLQREHGDLHFLVVGDGPDRAALEAQAAATEHPDRIHFAGRQIPADRFYYLMDVFSTAPQREAFGLVAAEAMRAGLPVVATRVGGLAGIVEDGVTGTLVPPRSVAALAAALEPLINDAGLRTAMGGRGRQQAERRYSPARYAADMAAVYGELLPAADPAPPSA